MKILPIQDVYSRKFERQRKIDKLEYHAAGHCVHIGKISPGCYSCFVADKFGKNILAGSGCNCDCEYCASGSCTSMYGKDKKSGKEEEMENLLRFKADRETLINDSKMPDYNPSKMSFSGGGEPLMYMDNISMYMELFRDLHKSLEKKPWYYLYTNGTLATEKNLERLNALGFDEIRFHLGATNFSERVYANMRRAVKYIETVSVETPAWPLHREKLFQMLPIIQDIGVKHLNITEVELNKNNFDRVFGVFPDGEICQCGELQLYDNGLVYDLMEEVVRRGYTFSVLDCNCFVKSIQRTPGKWLCHETVHGLCADREVGHIESVAAFPTNTGVLRSEIIPKRVRGIERETFGDGVLLYHQTTGEAIYLNSSAAVIWTLCDGDNSVAKIEEILERAYPDERSTIQTDMDSVLEQLQKNNAIEF